MSINWVLYIVTGMIFWDFSLHVLDILDWSPKFTHSKSIFSYYYPHFRFKKTPNGPVERDNWYSFYTKFWVAYWGIAFVLMASYLVFR